jgi:hypothetical protein
MDSCVVNIVEEHFSRKPLGCIDFVQHPTVRLSMIESIAQRKSRWNEMFSHIKHPHNALSRRQLAAIGAAAQRVLENWRRNPLSNNILELEP